jgi:hypothetical protein
MPYQSAFTVLEMLTKSNCETASVQVRGHRRCTGGVQELWCAFAPRQRPGQRAEAQLMRGVVLH